MKPRIYWARLVDGDIAEVFSVERSARARSCVYGPVVLAPKGEKPEKGGRWAVVNEKRRLLRNPYTGVFLVFRSRGWAQKWSRFLPGASVAVLRRAKNSEYEVSSRRGARGYAE